MKKYIKSDRSSSRYDMSQFNKEQQEQIRFGLENGVDVSVYADPRYDDWQMQLIRLGLEKGLDVSIYADPRYDRWQMEQISYGLEKGFDVSWYADPKYTWYQMAEIRLGLEAGLDVSAYADPKYNQWQMEQIREGLEARPNRLEKKSNRPNIRTATAGNIKFDPDVGLDQSEYDEYLDEYGAYPVAKYFIASPGYYGYGGYGSDWCATYYEMSDGSGLMTSPYSGTEQFNNRADMIKDIKETQQFIRKEIFENGYEEDGDLLANYDFI